MKILKTPPERFLALPGYSFQARYINVGSADNAQEQSSSQSSSDIEPEELMMHYVDYGDNEAPVILMLHGEPTWSYLYRKMICIAESHGFRVIAPDLIGFGKSDKFDDQGAYTYAKHLLWLERFIESLGLDNIHLICQDWGGLLGLRMVAKFPERFAAVVAANTMLPTGDYEAPEAFFKWQRFSQEVNPFPVSQVIQNATVKDLIPEVAAAYDAPFPSEEYKCGVRKFPLLVPTQADDVESQNNRDAWKILSTFNKPFMTAFSDSDPVTRGGDAIFQKLIPGCRGQAHVTLKGGGHFLQEDVGQDLINAALTCFKSAVKSNSKE
ncbi:haloalkane dehalogenase [Ningiella sp. W23]|uniref:haloalkane dehalogenase n=1 Tax=Ningiella sp. W23 TaxID=3023715 RepID=UPI0037580170